MRPSVQQPISKDKNVIARARKYYLKQLFDLEVKVPRRALRYATHRLMVMDPHTKYNWPISKDKNVMAWKRKYYLKKQLFDLEVKGHYGMRHTALWSCTHIPNITDRSGKTKMLWPRQENTIQKTIIWPWGQRLRSHERSLRYVTHRFMIMHPHTKYHWPISKEKKLWPGQENTI